MVEQVLFLHKKEATEVNANKHQGETRLREIQFQVNMDSYTVTLSVMHVIVMDILTTYDHIKNRKQLIL